MGSGQTTDGGSGFALTLVGGGTQNFTNSVSLDGLNINKSGGSANFAGNLVVDTALTTTAAPYSVSYPGSMNSIGGTTTFSNTGTLTIGDSATDTTTFIDGVVAAAPSSRSLGGTIQSTNSDILFGTGATSLNSSTTVSAGTGDVTLGSVNGAQTLVVNSTGTTTFGTVGGSTALVSLTTDAGGTRC